jgi:hypothetical protein
MIRKTPIVILFALLIIASLSCTNPIASYFSTRTAVMETATATMWTPTPTFTPTSTPTNTPTFTPTLTPTPDFLYADDFSDPTSGWLVVGTSPVLRAYDQGGYRITVKEANYSGWSRLPNKKNYSDTKVEVDGTRIGGPDDNDFGVICRYQDSKNFYALEISSAGDALIYKYENDIFYGLSNDSFTAADGINPGSDTNQITAVCNGDTLELYANGNLVASATDSSFTDGQIALMAGNYTTPGADILFDNLFVRIP